MAIGWPAGVGVVFAVACIGTWLARRYALARRLLDEPGERRSHTIATPRGGGIAIVAAMLLAMALAPIGVSPLLPRWPLAIGLLLVASVGWIDDHRPLSPTLRLVVHALAASCLGASAWAAGAGLVVVIASALLAVVLINVWNFMDGIDGLAASQALLVALGCALLAGKGGAAWLPLALAAACAGFLPFNLPRARIFLGDVGSGALGYLLAVLVTAQAAREPQGALLLLIPLSAFLVDATLTLGRRVLRRERWWLPHTQHAYQAWARRCGGHAKVTLAYAMWSVVMLLNLAWAATVRASAVKMLVLAACYAAGAMTWMSLQRTSHGDRE